MKVVGSCSGVLESRPGDVIGGLTGRTEVRKTESYVTGVTSVPLKSLVPRLIQ